MSKIHTCSACKYTTNRLWNYNKHVQTIKHLATTQIGCVNNNKPVVVQQIVKDMEPLFICNDCNKKYKHKSSLYRHHTQCLKTMVISKTEYELAMKCNKLEGRLEALKGIESNQIVNQVVQYNPTNINIYLNNNYKDAMNMKEFVEKLTLTMDDLIFTKDMGYVRGISNILLKNLKELSLEQRPIHCIREANTKELYIKDDNSWEKDKGLLDHEISKIKKLQIKDCYKFKETDAIVTMIKHVTDTTKANNKKIKGILKQNTELIL